MIMGPRGGLQTKRVRKPGKSPNMGLGLHRTIMVGHDPDDTRGRPLRPGGFRSLAGKPQYDAEVELAERHRNIRTTLCGSEVPQDRWRGRTAGSGMWTRTENLLSWSPCGDSAIPYG